MTKTKKWIWISLGILLAIFIGLLLIGKYSIPINLFFNRVVQEKVYNQMVAQRDALLAAQKADNIGGKTPEETLDMYIAALKAGDVNLASKYAEISPDNPKLQSRELSSLNEAIKRDGDLGIVLRNMDDIINKGIKHIWSPTEVSFVYDFITKEQSTSTSIVSGKEIVIVRPAGFKSSFGVALKLNPYTKVWKIVQ
ncbi:MAG: hypothetical protein WCO10_03635 [bacterium]